MIDILDIARSSREEPKLIVRKAPHAAVWSVWAVLEGIPPEEIFEGSSEEEASSWINIGGQAWLEERRRKRIQKSTRSRIREAEHVPAYSHSNRWVGVGRAWDNEWIVTEKSPMTR